MAFSSPRAGVSISRRALQQCKPPLPCQPFASPAARFFSGSPARQQEMSFEDRIAADPVGNAAKAAPNEQDLPRWAKTPDRMKAPFSLAIPRGDEAPVWKVNENPRVLDDFYDRFLGREGHKILPDELKWLAVTHKSFDQGRRGFNTRLAHFGRQILVLEAIRFIMATPPAAAPAAEPVDESDVEPEAEIQSSRKPFEHPALANIDKLSLMQPKDLLSQKRLTKLALKSGLNEVARWTPKNARNLDKSGQVIVLHSALYAIIGAVSLQNGAAVASRICRDRILTRLDI